MRLKTIATFLLLQSFIITLMAGPVNIIPYPAKLSKKWGHFTIRPSTRLIIDGNNQEVRRLAHFFTAKLKTAGGPEISIVEKNKTKPGRFDLQFTLESPPTGLGKEGYELTIRRKSLILRASSGNGLFYGIITLFQLLPPEIEGNATAGLSKWTIPCLHITDFPRFPYRGLHLDVSRHFFPVEFIKEYIDLLSYYKMNTFHWHLTDDQGWRLEIKKYPLLTQIGSIRKGTQVAKSDQTDNTPYGGFYTQEQVRDVVRYAAERYITIIPEIEMPGHAVAALTAYPQYSCSGGPFELRTTWGVSDDVFCPGKDSTFLFIRDILKEVMDLFPSVYIHIGGDEVPKSRWIKCPRCQERIRAEGLKNEQELQSYFVRRIEKFLTENGRKLIGWDEILEGGIAAEATVMSWRGTEGGIEAARQGHDVVMTPGAYCYLDHYQADPSYEPLAIGGFTNLKKVYSYEPVPSELTPEQSGHILGAQGNLWTEYMEKGDHVLYMAYPRAIALAEVDWSPAKSRKWDNFVTRLESSFKRLDLKKVNYCKSLYDVNITTQYSEKHRAMEIAMGSDWKGVDIRYTTDNSEPGLNSPVYKKPFRPGKTTLVKAAVFQKKTRKGRTNERQVLVHKAYGAPVELLQPYSPKYPGKGLLTITDGLNGALSFRAGEWQGFEGNDFEAVIDLKVPTQVNTITATFMKNIYSWIFLPLRVEYFISNDGKVFEQVGSIDCPAVKEPGVEIRPFSQSIGNKTTRFIKIKAQNNKICPPWHEAAGQPCWLFVDEVIVE
ncbi:MAG: family 20 glycosylhydrolase [Bacteroidetes bacterium]|nr:family 20 glycosylhydrolase [Bacteroidota bacterium]